jgi:hypothetical protein
VSLVTRYCPRCGRVLRSTDHHLAGCPSLGAPPVLAGADHVPGERPTSEYSDTAIAIARETGRLRVDRDGLGWIHGMEPDLPKAGKR